MLSKEEIFKKRWFILFSVLIVTFMSCLDASIVNVALPVISKDLGVSMSSVQWTVTTYLIVISALLLTLGRLGDLKGKTQVFRIGIMIFTLGSLLCGISNNIEFLIISRAIQGFGAAFTMANSQGIITAVFEPQERGKALGILGLVVAFGSMLGPALGGVISEFKWEYIFLINIPIGIVAMILSFKVLPNLESHAKKGDKIDFIGTILFAITIVSLIVSITEGSIYGFTDTKILIGFAVAIVAFVLFIISQLKLSSPILDLRIFKIHRFSKGVFASLLSFTAMSSFTILLPFYYEIVRGISPMDSGFLMIVSPVALAIFAPISGSLSDRFNSELFPVIGFIVTAIGFALIATLGVHTPIYVICIFIFIIGAGLGLFQSPMNSIVMSSVDRTKLGIAGSVNALVRNLGMIFGITFGTSLLYSIMSSDLGYTVRGFVPGHSAIFVDAMDKVFIVATVICIVGIITTLSIFFKVRKERRELNN